MTTFETSRTSIEIGSQPAVWRRTVESVSAHAAALPRRGERVAVVGCGTSWFMAHAYAQLREAAGHGETDAFAASEFPHGRRYDRILAISRSGTTTEVLDLLGRVRGTVPTSAITADPDSPVMTAADAVAVLDFADEESVVQTRFATTVLVLLRAHLEAEGAPPPGAGPVAQAVEDARRALDVPLGPELTGAEQFTFLGTGWTYGLAQEAALKMREAAGAWTEAYPAMEYRHGPISITRPGRVTWLFGAAVEGLAGDVARVGGHFVSASTSALAPASALASASRDTGDALDPLADLVIAQRLAVHLALASGQNPDTPRNLTRSVILRDSPS